MLPARLARLLHPPLGALADLLYPPHCVGCGQWQPRDRWMCPPCAATVRRVDGPRCLVCSRPFDGALDAFQCPNCRGDVRYFDFAVAVVRAEGIARELIHRFKYGREFPLRRVLGDWLVEAFADPRIAAMEDVTLVPVPLHAARQRERRFNQSEALADWVSRRRAVAVAQPLVRNRPTVTQTRFDRRQRMRNLRDAFALRHNADVNDKCFLLVDDVLTTGSTLDECARVLLAGGARSVRAITVARG